jgi:hypothetical protein
MFKKIKNSLISKLIPANSWKDIERFDNSWDVRVSTMSKLVSSTSRSVVDLGCGRSKLESYLGVGVSYLGVDYKKRNDKTCVCDFNEHQFVSGRYDTVFISGVLEYIDDVDWFANQVKRSANNEIIISYCTTDLNPSLSKRLRNGWKNHLSAKLLVDLFEDNIFKLDKVDFSIEKNPIFRFEKISHNDE